MPDAALTFDSSMPYAEFFCQLLLRQIFLSAFLCNVISDSCLVHIACLLYLRYFEYMAKTNANTSISGRISVELSLIKRLFRAGLCALVAKNALRAVFPLAGFLVDLHVHRTDP